MKTALLVFAACVSLLSVPGRAAEAAETLVPNRLAQARVGEWASYRLPSGYIQKLTVTKREGEGPEAMVTVLAENIYDGEVVTAHEIVQEAGEALTAPRIRDDGAAVTVRREEHALGGTSRPVTIVHIERKGEDEDDYRSTEWWTSPDVPVFGIVKRIEEGETEWEIAEWGE